ncbi:MAG TPA: ATP-binding protein [Acetobacteraceae bacterium]|nr:ATP-binding protein [Acetobacteraceae bacterium]
MRMIAIVGLVTAVPIVGLLVLVVTGLAATGPTLLVLLLTIVAGLVFGLVWVRDLRRMSNALRQLPTEGTSADFDAAPDAASGLALVRPLGREIRRLSRRLTARAALSERHRLADTMILERLPDPLIVLDADQLVRRANTGARAAFGGDMPAVLRHPDLRAAIERAMASGAQQTAELSLPVPVPRDVHATVVPMDPPLADGGRIVVVLSDRTRERAVERMRADFVANASHELRTPLASLIGFTETLRGPAADDPPAQQRFLAIMAEQGARMNRLIDDLLSLSRIELTEHQPPSEMLDLHALIPRLAAGFEPRLNQQGARLVLEVAADLPAIPGDDDQIAQVLQNLLDNAMKYGRTDGTVGLHAASAQPNPRWPNREGVVIAVSDDGAGIPRAHLPRLTERFYRVDRGRSRAAGGTGLGLAIVKHIVNRHRGQMLIESEEGKGTTVSIWLPAGSGGAGSSAAN